MKYTFPCDQSCLLKKFFILVVSRLYFMKKSPQTNQLTDSSAVIVSTTTTSGMNQVDLYWFNIKEDNKVQWLPLKQGLLRVLFYTS